MCLTDLETSTSDGDGAVEYTALLYIYIYTKLWDRLLMCLVLCIF